MNIRSSGRRIKVSTKQSEEEPYRLPELPEVEPVEEGTKPKYNIHEPITTKQAAEMLGYKNTASFLASIKKEQRDRFREKTGYVNTVRFLDYLFEEAPKKRSLAGMDPNDKILSVTDQFEELAGLSYVRKREVVQSELKQEKKKTTSA